jgi:two-component system LytT family sensor kinase
MNTATATSPVKVNWRKQEMIFVSIIFFLFFCDYLWEAFSAGEKTMRENFAQVYAQHQLSFNYFLNVLLPQLVVILPVYGSYLLLNRGMSRFSQNKNKWSGWFPAHLRVELLFLLINVVLAFAVASATDLAHPWLVNYGNFHLLSLFGYQPNLFRAFTQAFLVTGFFTAYMLIREVVIYYIERTGLKNGYRVHIANQVTGIVFIYFLVFLLLHFFDLFNSPHFRIYFSATSPILLVYLSNMYWLFPRNEGQSRMFNSKYNISLATTTFIFTLPFLVAPVAQDDSKLFFLYWVAQMGIVTPVTRYIYQQNRDRILQLRNIEKALSRSKADIRLLRSQVNPHFLFNTLNTLYGTALQEGGHRTAEGIQRLGDMMRFMLQENEAEKISLQKEVEYLENYIALQQLRVQSSPNLYIESKLDSSQCNYSIAPMILIPLVENAFKHGISLVEKSWVIIQLACDNSGIQFEIRNSIHPGKKEDAIWESPGIGIANVTERLKLIYPGIHQIQFNNDGKEFHVQLTIRL